MQGTEARRFRLAWAGCCVALIALLSLFLNRPAWGDEYHFVETIQYFGSVPWSHAVRDYPEVTGPLFYLVYSAWGELFGFGLIPLRILSLVFALATLGVLFVLAERLLHSSRAAFWVCVGLVANPYWVGTSLFVFTDIPALMLILVTFVAYLRGNLGLAALAMSGALLVRQYALVFWVPLFAFVCGAGMKEAGNRLASYRPVSYWIAALIPFAGFAALWGGIAPPTGKRIWDAGAMTWNPQAFTAYVVFLLLYLWPFTPFWLRLLRRRLRLLPFALAAGSFALVFTVENPVIFREQGQTAIGFFHRGLQFLLGSGAILHGVLALIFSVGIWLLLSFAAEDWDAFRHRRFSPALLLSFSIYVFLIVMPLSYQIWEKYLLLVLPLAALRIFLSPAAMPLTQNRPSASTGTA